MGIIKRLKDKYAFQKEVKKWKPISEKLKKMYIDEGACDEWISIWGTPTREELLSKYINFCGLKFSIEHNIPSVDFIEKNLKNQCEDMGIYVNDVFVKSYNQPTVVLNGYCCGDIIIDYQNIALHDIHVRHNSNVNVFALKSAYVWVKIYGENAHVKCTVEDKATIIVFYMNETGIDIISKEIIKSNNKEVR